MFFLPFLGNFFPRPSSDNSLLLELFGISLYSYKCVRGTLVFHYHQNQKVSCC